MPLQITSGSASSNRIAKRPSRNAFNKIIGRSNSNIASPTSHKISSFRRTKPTSTRASPAPVSRSGEASTSPASPSDPTRASKYLDCRELLLSRIPIETIPSLSDVISLISHILSRRFSPLPLSGGGFSKERIAELLRFRKNVPSFVPLPVLYAYSESATGCDREVDELVRRGVLRRIVVQGRGQMGEGLVRMEEYERRLRVALLGENEKEDEDVETVRNQKVGTHLLQEEEIRDAVTQFLQYLKQNPTSTTYPSPALSPSEFKLRKPQLLFLLRCGFLSLFSPSSSISQSNLNPTTAVKLQSTVTSLSAISSSILPPSQPQTTSSNHPTYTITLPNLGPYLRSLSTAKSIILDIISKASPKTNLVPLDFLQARYHEPPSSQELEEIGGELEGTSAVEQIPTARIVTRITATGGRGAPLSRTKKWNVKMGGYGLGLDFVLAELLGEGKLEVVNTGVGIGVKIR